MLTIFTIPKPFRDHIEIIQRNAIQSWLSLRPQCEVILCGDDFGVAEIAEECGARHLSDIACNEYETPLLNSAFDQVQRVAKHRLICYVNADIILLSELLAAVQRIPFPRFLMVGQRWNLDVTTPIDFEDELWDQRIKEQVASNGILQAPMGSDYFVFVEGTIGELPDFAVGRPGWDNWMIYHARALGMPVIDATRVNMDIHQNHGYGHVAHRYDDASYSGPEADRNLELMGGNRTRFTLMDATHLLTERKLATAWQPKYLYRRFRTLAALHPQLRPLARLIRSLCDKVTKS